MRRANSVTSIQRRNNGAALLIVLLLLATISVLAIAMTDTMRLTAAKSVASDAANQARWYVHGAETFSTMLMRAQWEAAPGNDTMQDRWVSETATFPIDDGILTARLRDETVCFNVNSLVTGSPEMRSASTPAIEEYALLLTALGFSSSARASLTDALVDWLDTDGLARADGAEDREYGSLEAPYRAGNGLIADISELRAVYWYSAEIYRRLKPFLCAHPSSEMSAINLNMLTEEKIPILYAMLGGILSINETKQLIEARPEQGFSSLDQFWSLNSQFVSNPPNDTLRARPRLWSSYARLEANVNHAGATLTMTSLLEISNAGAVSVKARKFGSIE